MFSKNLLKLITRCRSYSTLEKIQGNKKACAWQVHSYGDINELQYGEARIPPIENPDDVLINVEACSVNPIDLAMLGGYGRTLLKPLRGCDLELPLTLGRDFCGTIVNKGHGVGRNLNIGDQVYGFVPLHKQGSFSEVVLANKSHILKKPEDLTPAESTSMVYAAMTAWSALYIFGNLTFKGANGAKILVLGASGGVGTAAVQLLKSQGSIVYGSCSNDAIPLVQSLGAEHVFDYKDSSYLENIAAEGYYHIILDCAKFGYDNVPKNWKFGTYITLNSPLLKNTDKYGLVGGLINSAGAFLKNNLKPPGQEKCWVWGFFVPSGGGFQFIDTLIKNGKICSVIQKEFKFENLPDAFKALKEGHTRGKIVVTH